MTRASPTDVGKSDVTSLAARPGPPATAMPILFIPYLAFEDSDHAERHDPLADWAGDKLTAMRNGHNGTAPGSHPCRQPS